MKIKASKVFEVFGGVIKTSVECLNCSHRSITCERYYDFNIVINQDKGSRNANVPILCWKASAVSSQSISSKAITSISASTARFAPMPANASSLILFPKWPLSNLSVLPTHCGRSASSYNFP